METALNVEESIAQYAQAHNITAEVAVARMIKWASLQKNSFGKLLQYAIDVLSDEYVSQEVYQSNPDLLILLKEMGTKEMEIIIREYLARKPETFTCRSSGCSGKIVGACPLLYCESCKRRHLLKADGLEEAICSKCAAQKTGECTAQTRSTAFKIYLTDLEVPHGI